MAKKIIHIFLGSSIVEFKTERLELTEFIRDLSDKFEDSYDIKIKPVICENVDTNIPRSGGKQDEYNELIKNSEMCFFIFFTRAGEFTCEEFEVAYKALQESGKPKIYVYFKNIPEGQSADPSRVKFMSRIDNEVKHYHGTFDDIDTIKLRILLNLKLQEMDFLEVKYKDGKCYAGGIEVEKLDINKVSEFKNNSGLKDLRAELERVQQKYLEMRPLYEEKQNDEKFYIEYADVKSRRKILLDRIEETEREIFAFSLGMSDGVNKGELTPRQQRAYRYFEQGDLERANAELDGEILDRDFDNLLLMGEMVSKKVAVSIREYRTKIYILSAMTKYDGRFDEIEKIYDKIVPAAFKYIVETDVLFDYADYLREQNRLYKAAEIYSKLERLYLLHGELVTEIRMIHLLHKLRFFYGFLNIDLQYISSYKPKIKILTAMTDYPDRYAEIEAIYEEIFPIAEASFLEPNVFFDYADYLRKQNKLYKAAEIYKHLEDVYKANTELATQNVIARLYFCQGVLYSDLNDKEKSAQYYLKAAVLYQDITLLPQNKYEYNNVWKFYLKLIENYCEIDKIVNSKNNFYYEIKGNGSRDIKSNKDIIKEDIMEIEEQFKNNTYDYDHELADCFDKLGIIYYKLKNYKKAVENSLKALNAYEQLYLKNQELYLKKLQNLYKWVGDIYDELGESDKADEYREKAEKLNS